MSQWVSADAPYSGVGAIRFADSTEWLRDTIEDMLCTGTDGNDLLIGFSSMDTMTGAGGDDTLYARGGDDSVIGGTGNDMLYGEAGSDILDAGVGKDELEDEDTSDPYLFFRKGGQKNFGDAKAAQGSSGRC